MGRLSDDVARLVRAHQSGEPGAIRLLVERVQRPLLHQATSILRNPTSAEDAFIQAMTNALPRVAKFDRPEAYWSFLRVTIRNQAVDILRSKSERDSLRALRDTRRREAGAPEGLEPLPQRLPDPGPQPDEEVDSARLRHRVREAMEALQEPRKTILRLFYDDELSYAQIGEQLSISPAGVKRHLRAARLLLAARLRGLEEELHAA